MRSLNARTELTKQEKSYYQNLERGYEGELMFDVMTAGLPEERYIIEDLQLEVNHSFFQLDTVIISQGVIHLIDVKNYLWACYMEGEKLRAAKSGMEYKNPFTQLSRSVNLFRQLLQNLQLNFVVEAHVLFINPEFTLYHAPMDLPAILPTQINQFLSNLSGTPSKLTDKHSQLASQLLTLHQPNNPNSKVPEYDYNCVRKGNFCRKCGSFELIRDKHEFACKVCGTRETFEAAIMRNVKEFQLLFPERRITTTSIFEWCEPEVNIRTVRRVLKKCLNTVGKTSDTYFN